MPETIRIKLVRSPICTPEKHKAIVRALGLKKINQVVERPDSPGFRGMVKKVPHLLESTIPHQVLGRFGAGMVLLKPAAEGTGVIAGGPVRAVIQATGIANVLTKSIGSHNPHNVVKATIDALEQLRDKNAVADMRGLAVEKL